MWSFQENVRQIQQFLDLSQEANALLDFWRLYCRDCTIVTEGCYNDMSYIIGLHRPYLYNEQNQYVLKIFIGQNKSDRDSHGVTLCPKVDSGLSSSILL